VKPANLIALIAGPAAFFFTLFFADLSLAMWRLQEWQQLLYGSQPGGLLKQLTWQLRPLLV
jgi:hypothetical protein